MKWLPNLISLLNLFLGCVALVLVFQGMAFLASILVFVCAALDYLDGAAARWLKAGTETGKQLDALADLVSFGVLPSAIMFTLLMDASHRVKPDQWHFVFPFVAFFIATASAWRLARFNVNEQDDNWFSGLPTPANAMLIASIPFVLHQVQESRPVHMALTWLVNSQPALLALVGILSALLVSRLKMFSLKMTRLGWRGNELRLIFFAGCVLLFFAFGLSAAPLFLFFYLFLSLLGQLVGWIRSSKPVQG